MKKLLKKNQVIIYVIAIMLMTAGYLNYTTNQDGSLETSIQMEAKDDIALADIGDATLVSSNDIIGGDTTETNTTNTTENELISNTTSTDSESTNTNETAQTRTTASSSKDDYFTKSKLERDTMYSQMIETYEKVLNSSNSLETQKQAATQEITKINETKNSIMICENLIKTKGFENCIVFVNGESVSVIVGISEIKQEEVAQIQNIVSRELSATIENIHISTK
ncbi:MAG: SpoIIIAH-like family protein [Clostridia bacterium]